MTRLERLGPGTYRHTATGRLIVKQADGWRVMIDGAHGAVPLGRRAFRTLNYAVVALENGEVR